MKWISVKYGVSQAILADTLNVKTLEVAQGRMQETPSDLAVKILDLVERKGLEVLL